MRLRGVGAALVAAVVLVPAAPGAAASTVTWNVALDQIGDDDVNVAYARGGLTVAGESAQSASVRSGRVSAYQITRRTTTAPVNRVRADVAAATPAGTAVIVEVRAELGPQRWSEWTAVPATLPDTTVLEVRITLDGPATVESVRIIAERGEPLVRPFGLGDTYRIFATRVGLVGGATANGHVITSRDHFVALPSRRGLAPKNTGDYTVRVCAAAGRCEWAPVWDVGPWNVTDDYWNPPSVRQSWTDLPQGKPEVQAAYQEGYNGGKDGYGRRVRNPAGIDLADGTFWDGLRLTNNAWVDVTYLWTGTGLRGTVRTPGSTLTVRDGPRVDASAVGMAANHARLIIECQVAGDTVTYGTTNRWNRLAPGYFVSDAYVNTGSAPTC
ncbi:hypothetical protein [Micromonospora sp. CPCC 206061]|uniref:hypothetical protein n=1 Tax=Micromonospora sp. CPCC 206061 TaxID=3122410 RepID=UPI002FF0D532